MSKRMATQAYHLKVERDEDGVFVGTVPELPGCVSQGITEKELLENMEEAILLYLETRDAGRDLPKVVWVEKAHA
ncbi:MAG TPA: type II toxin-antitoxin system HicB family antitoxin [Thermoplasmata archaeon]|jgi:predicted RNase H-like HicB family nuclease